MFVEGISTLRVYRHAYTSERISVVASLLYQLGSTPHLNLSEVNRTDEILDHYTFQVECYTLQNHQTSLYIKGRRNVS